MLLWPREPALLMLTTSLWSDPNTLVGCQKKKGGPRSRPSTLRSSPFPGDLGLTMFKSCLVLVYASLPRCIPSYDEIGSGGSATRPWTKNAMVHSIYLSEDWILGLSQYLSRSWAPLILKPPFEDCRCSLRAPPRHSGVGSSGTLNKFDKLLNIAVTRLAATANQDCAPILSPGCSENDLSKVLLPRLLAHRQYSVSTSERATSRALRK